MRRELYYFEISPICFLTDREVCLHIRALNGKYSFESGKKYTIKILEVSVAQESRFTGSGCTRECFAESDENGVINLTVSCRCEGMYFIKVYDEDRIICTLRVYALDNDMKGLYPYRGDFHMHTCRSDGSEDPFTVVGNYREAGYDFTIISDHGRYYPSLQARKKFRIGPDDSSPITDMLIIPGEEVHLPLNDVHYINCGGQFSINALVTPNANQELAGDCPSWRSLSGNCPPVMTREDFINMIRERAEIIDRPLESERLSMAVSEWTYEKVAEGGGLGIFPHPYWLCETMQLSEDYVYYFYKRKPFDAFEVLGGESYYQHNGFQTSFYYENREAGFKYPVVGSTDSHGSTDMNGNSRICSTIVFSTGNTTAEIIDAVKGGRSVAVDTISAEYRLVGDFRYVKYASFLMEEWYPLHDRLCVPQGFYMREFANGNSDAEGILVSLKGQVPKMEKRLFELD
ncbi:MAG: PHP domain-containing protein [Clostridia bacterium]|nr:PHP domain-containing protein [Clostridia bacterium]